MSDVKEVKLAESVFDLPWFVEVESESRKRLNELYDFDPQLVPVWYREVREEELREQSRQNMRSHWAIPVSKRE